MLLGYPMARNLRSKIPQSDTLIIHDRNSDATSRFVEETGSKGKVEIAATPKDAAEKSVGDPIPNIFLVHVVMSMFQK